MGEAMSGGRRLDGHIAAALDLAIDQEDVAVADLLARALEMVLLRHGGPDIPERRVDGSFEMEVFDRLSRLRRIELSR